jgi:hypothetical protein
MARVTVSLRGTKEARQLLDSLSGRELQNRVRRGTRAGAKVFREKVRAEARSRADIPDSFAKTATKGHRMPVGTSTGPTSPLLNIFEGGAGQHPIYPHRHRFLSNFSARRQAADRATGGVFFAYGPVTHPGMSARPLIGPVFDANEDDASREAMDEMLADLR